VKRHLYDSHVEPPGHGTEQENGDGLPAELGSVHGSYPILAGMENILIETGYEEDRCVSRFAVQHPET
jgi:hypothetical protein